MAKPSPKITAYLNNTVINVIGICVISRQSQNIPRLLAMRLPASSSAAFSLAMRACLVLQIIGRNNTFITRSSITDPADRHAISRRTGKHERRQHPTVMPGLDDERTLGARGFIMRMAASPICNSPGVSVRVSPGKIVSSPQMTLPSSARTQSFDLSK